MQHKEYIGNRQYCIDPSLCEVLERNLKLGFGHYPFNRYRYPDCIGGC